METIGPPKEPYRYQRYPLVMHGAGSSMRVHSEEEEKAAIEAGYGFSRPPQPEPEVSREAMSVEDRLTALESDVAELKSRRGPGRPKKEDS